MDEGSTWCSTVSVGLWGFHLQPAVKPVDDDPAPRCAPGESSHRGCGLISRCVYQLSKPHPHCTRRVTVFPVHLLDGGWGCSNLGLCSITWLC